MRWGHGVSTRDSHDMPSSMLSNEPNSTAGSERTIATGKPPDRAQTIFEAEANFVLNPDLGRYDSPASMLEYET